MKMLDLLVQLDLIYIKFEVQGHRSKSLWL